MSLKNKTELECLANRLREEMNLRSKDPVSIHQILREKNILAWFKELDPNFSGMAIRTGQKDGSSTKYFMLINTAQSYAKQRFTACHEIYHLLYQENFISSQNNAGLFDEKKTEEYNADCFASYLLLPEFGLKELVPIGEQKKDQISIGTLLRVEQNFRCSRKALLVRLKELSWISQSKFELYSKGVKKSAIEYGYSTSLYSPTNKTELVGDYNLKARQLYDSGRISQAKYFSLLLDMGMDINSDILDGEE